MGEYAMASQLQPMLESLPPFGASASIKNTC